MRELNRKVLKNGGKKRMKVTYATQLKPKGTINVQAMVSFEFEENETDKVIEVIKKLEENS
jgi:hypothetical protein